MKTYRVQIWGGGSFKLETFMGDLSVAAHYLYLACKNEFGNNGVSADYAQVHFTDIRTWAFKNIYISGEHLDHHAIQAFVVPTLQAYNRLVNAWVNVDSIKEIK